MLTDDDVLNRLLRVFPADDSVAEVMLNRADRSESIEIRLSAIRRFCDG